MPTSIVASGFASRLWIQCGWACVRLSSRRHPAVAVGQVHQRVHALLTGAPSGRMEQQERSPLELPPTRPSFARNSSMMFEFQSAIRCSLGSSQIEQDSDLTRSRPPCDGTRGAARKRRERSSSVERGLGVESRMLRFIVVVAVAIGATSLALPAGAVGQSFTVKVDGTPPAGDPWAFLRFFPGASLRVLRGCHRFRVGGNRHAAHRDARPTLIPRRGVRTIRARATRTRTRSRHLVGGDDGDLIENPKSSLRRYVRDRGRHRALRRGERRVQRLPVLDPPRNRRSSRLLTHRSARTRSCASCIPGWRMC